MSKKKKLIPELRFPEFEKVEEWEEKSLDKVVNDFIVPMRDKPKNLDGEIPWCRIEDFNVMYLSGSKSNQGVSSETIKGMNLKVYPVNTLLVSCSADLGRCAITQNPLVTNQTFIGLVPNEKKVNTVYLYYVMTNSRNELNARSSGTTISYLSRQEFEKFEITLPKLKEQQKIASCLASLDDLIEFHNKKLDLLKDHKKGLMQNLFPQEGKKVPKYRFKEFEKDGKWVEKILDEVAKFSKGKGISKADVVENGTLPCIRYGELYTHYKETINDIISFTNVPAEDLVLSKDNDVIIPSSGETQEDIATASCVMKEGIALGGDLNIIRTKLNGVFLSYYLNNAKKREIAQMAQGISVVHLYSSQLKSLKIQIPSKLEQQKIASCLSALDEIIVAQTEKIEQLKQHKKGLMQGLFPKIID